MYFILTAIANLKKLLVSSPQVYKFLHTWAPTEFFLKEFQHFLDLVFGQGNLI